MDKNRRIKPHIIICHLAIVCILMLAGGCHKKPEQVENKTIYIDGNLQDNIDKVNHGDTVIIRNGTYRENIWIVDDMTVIGETKDAVIIIPTTQNMQTGVLVDRGAKVTLKNLTIKCSETSSRNIVDFGFAVCGNAELEISDCSASGAKFQGIMVHNSKANIHNCNFENNQQYGVDIRGSEATIRNCMLFSNGYGGVCSSTKEEKGEKAFSKIEVAGCYCRGGKYGLYAEGNSTGEIRNSTISSTTISGVYTSDCTGSLIIKGNGVKDNKFGIQLYHPVQTEVIGNTVSNSSESGILIRETNEVVTVKDNQSNNNKYEGIFVYNPNSDFNVYISNNKCSGNGHCGIWTQEGKVVIEGNECNNNLENGIGINYFVTGKILNNTCKANNQVGIRTYHPANKMIIEQNVLEDNGMWGIYGFGEGVDVAANITSSK